MTNFSNFTKLDVSAQKTARYTMYRVAGEPVLIVAPATQANTPYFNRLLKRSAASARRIKAGGSISPAMLKENRVEDRELYARYVLRGWEGVKDAEGKDVEFTATVAKEFLDALPDWLFDELRIFCGDAGNFVEEDDATDDDVDTTAGN